MVNPTISRREPPVRPSGEGRSLWRATLEAGAALLQDMTPLKDFDIYVAGLHCAKHQPDMQMEAHHFCRQVNQDFIQCVLFDGNTKEANLIGVEYTSPSGCSIRCPTTSRATGIRTTTRSSPASSSRPACRR